MYYIIICLIIKTEVIIDFYILKQFIVYKYCSLILQVFKMIIRQSDEFKHTLDVNSELIL